MCVWLVGEGADPMRRPLVEADPARAASVPRWQTRLWVASRELALWDLGGCLLWLGACALAVGLAAPVPLRVILGVPSLLFVPGYVLVAALFPADLAIDGVERLGLAFALSLSLIPLVALGLHYSPWPLTLWPIVIGLDLTTLMAALVAVARRWRAKPGERFLPCLPAVSIPSPRSWNRLTRLAVVLGICSLMLLGTAAGVLLAARVSGDPTTEFALYNADGTPAAYPRQASPQHPLRVMLSITNDEGHLEHYRLVVTAQGRIIDTLPDIPVASGHRWQEPVTVAATVNGTDVPVLFQLFRQHDPTTGPPYRLLRLFLNPVTPTPVLE